MGIGISKFRSKLSKYFWVSLTAIIAIFTIVVSVRTVGDMIRTNKRSNESEQRIAQLESRIARDSIFIHQLTTSPEFLEKFTRESYHMQRPGETVYILEE